MTLKAFAWMLCLLMFSQVILGTVLIHALYAVSYIISMVYTVIVFVASLALMTLVLVVGGKR